jgi:hypothetical protein
MFNFTKNYKGEINMKKEDSDTSGLMPDYFDRLLGQLDGLPDMVRSNQVALRDIPLFGIGGSQTFIIQTCRQREQGDYVFLEHVSTNGTIRIVLPPKVVNVILRQHDQLTSKTRSKLSKAAMARRMAEGYVPTFARSTYKRKPKKKKEAK